MTCEYIDICGFLKHMGKVDALTVSTVMMTYCESDKRRCARYARYQVVAADDVPDHLWPNDEE